MTMLPAFSSLEYEPTGKFRSGRPIVRLTKPLMCHLSGRPDHIVPAGFETDRASVPVRIKRWFSWLLPSDTKALAAPAARHDHEYRTKTINVTRLQADLNYLEGMALTRVPWWRRWERFLAVRAVGASSFIDRDDRWLSRAAST